MPVGKRRTVCRLQSSINHEVLPGIQNRPIRRARARPGPHTPGGVKRWLAEPPLDAYRRRYVAQATPGLLGAVLIRTLNISNWDGTIHLGVSWRLSIRRSYPRK